MKSVRPEPDRGRIFSDEGPSRYGATSGHEKGEPQRHYKRLFLGEARVLRARQEDVAGVAGAFTARARVSTLLSVVTKVEVSTTKRAPICHKG